MGKERAIIGVDIGETNIKCALVNINNMEELIYEKNNLPGKVLQS